MLSRLSFAALLALGTGCTFGGGDNTPDDVDAGDVDDPTFPSGHLFRKTIEVKPVTDGELGGFVLAVFSTGDDQIAAAAQPDGSDLMLTEVGSIVPLAIELESYDPETGAFALWVARTLKVESLHLYYGLGEEKLDNQQPTLTWPGDVCAVWHGPIKGDLAIDSSLSGLDAEPDANKPLPAVVTGAVGVGLDMTTISARFETDSTAIVFPDTSFTFSVWVNTSAAGGATDQPWHYGGNSETVPGYTMELGTGLWRAKVSGGGETNTANFGNFEEFQSEWTHLVAVVDRSSDQILAYANGQLRDTAPIAETVDLSPQASMHASLGGVSPFVGVLDEMRINSSALGARRILEQHANLTEPEFLTIGNQEAAP